MREYSLNLLTSACAALALAVAAPLPGHAAGKIVCWKDASGKTIGCGDTVPPEYRDAATRELDSRGVTRKTVESAEDVARRREEAQAQARQKAEEEKKMTEQRRQDSTLLATFSNTGEIDAKRDREIQTLEFQIQQERAALKSVTERYDNLMARKEGPKKPSKPAPAGAQDELTRVESEKTRLEESIAAKEKEKEELKQKYADMKARYSQLRGGAGGTQKK